MRGTLRIESSEVIKPAGQKEYREYTIVHEADGVTAESRHRYSAFLELHERIPSLAGTRFPAPKSLFGFSNENAIHERVRALQEYLLALDETLEGDERALLCQFLNVPEGPAPAASAPAAAAPETEAPPPAKFMPSVDLAVDPTSADGRVSLEIRSAHGGKHGKGAGGFALAERLLRTPALAVPLGLILLALFGALVCTSSGASVAGPLGAASGCAAAEGSVTLSSFPSGLVYAYSSGEWSALCAGSMPEGAADFVCRELGYEKATSAFSAPRSESPVLAMDRFEQLLLGKAKERHVCHGPAECKKHALNAELLAKAKERHVCHGPAECKKHALNAEKPLLCDEGHSQAITCEGGAGPPPEARNCVAPTSPPRLRTQAQAARAGAGGHALSLAALASAGLVALVALAAAMRPSASAARARGGGADALEMI